MKSSEVAQSCPTLCDPVDCSPSGSSSMGFSRQEYWSGLLQSEIKSKTQFITASEHETLRDKPDRKTGGCALDTGRQSREAALGLKA